MLVQTCQRTTPSRHLSALVYVAKRFLLTLAIETSCDDTSVAVLEKHDDPQNGSLLPQLEERATLYFHKKVTADNLKFGGVHPLVSLDSHQSNLAILIKEAIKNLPDSSENTGGCEHGETVQVRTEDGYLQKRKPDLISVTRGPGMRSSLSTGLDTAKGLAAAWQVPIVGVNHMQGHALTHQLVAALDNTCDLVNATSFPFLSLLVSGGHTLIVQSSSLNSHKILADTSDIAVGDALDKIARSVLPAELLRTSGEIMYGRLLERFVFPDGGTDYGYTAPLRRHEEIERRESQWGWSLGIPLAETKHGSKSKSMEFSFSGLSSHCSKIVETRGEQMDIEERRYLGREAMRIAFEHLASRVVMGLWHIEGATATVAVQAQQQSSLLRHNSVVATSSHRVLHDGVEALPPSPLSDRLVKAGAKQSLSARAIKSERPTDHRSLVAEDGDDHDGGTQRQSTKVIDLVVSGGVAANLFLRAVLRSYLVARNLSHIKLNFPPRELCTDNAAMIGWTGIKMYEAGFESELSVRALRKWSLDDAEAPPGDEGGLKEGGGILGVEGWRRRRGKDTPAKRRDRLEQDNRKK
ncbi:MAG: hypothetical protein MMC33_002471 [Icmadophila ericetorum]|nr:hypothetical protein [Icmadophila ericetorum]